METFKTRLLLGVALVVLLCGVSANAILPLPIPPATATADPRCYLEPDYGECIGSFIRYYIEMASGLCRPFWYSGCMGNQNNFADMTQCEFWRRRNCAVQNPLLANVVLNPVSTLKVLG